MITRGKVWGNTSTIFQKNNVEMARIEINNGGYCSKHKHKYKHNMFFVEEGQLQVTIYRSDAGQILEDVTILNKGDFTYVEPGLYHSFKSLEDTVAFEIYWVELDVNDIERESVGGNDTI